MSLYDMYFSKKNKNYMFETLSKVIYEETDIQIKDSQKYMDLYRLHYPSIFESVSADEISILNKEIINRCLLYTSPSPRDRTRSRMPSSA